MGIKEIYDRIEGIRNKKKEKLGGYNSCYYDYYTKGDILEGEVDTLDSVLDIIKEECPEVKEKEE